MKALILYLIAAATFAAVAVDIDHQLDAMREPANLHGARDLQYAAEQGLERVDTLTVESCFRAWWAMERDALFLLGESLRYRVQGDVAKADVTIGAMSVLRFYAAREKGDVSCAES